MHDRGAMSPTTESGAHDKHARTTSMRARQTRKSDRGILSRQRFLCRNRDFSVTTNLYISKKKNPRKSGVSQRL